MSRLSIPKLSSRRKLIILASVAVLLPLFLLTVVQYRSLVDLENKTKASYRENLRQTLLTIEHKVQGRFQEVADQLLLPVASVRFSTESRPEQLEKYFASVKETHPEVDQIFALSFSGGDNLRPAFGFVRSDDFYTLRPGKIELHNVMHPFNMARSSQNFLDAGHRYLFWQDVCIMCFPHGSTNQATMLFYPLTDVNSSTPVGFVGVALNGTYVREQLLTRSIGEALNSPDLPFPGETLAVSVTDENQRDIYSTAAPNQEYIIGGAFSRPFANWKVRIGFKNTNVDAIARNSFWQSLLLTFVVVAVLILGIILMLRATDREVNLAQTKAAFVSNVSHELKTPLSLIRLFAELLEFDQVKKTEKRKEYYRIIGDESRRLSQLIDNILDFSRIEDGRMQYKFVGEDVKTIVDNVVSSYRYQISSSGFTLTKNLQPHLPRVILDRDAVSQALLNLLDNAVKYSSDVKEIAITVRTEPEHLTIEVADKGVGIARSEQARIFEKFYRVGNDLVHNVKGSGLGLSLIKHIMDAHGGSVSVSSEIGEGSVFKLSFPLDGQAVARNSPIERSGGYKVA